MRKTRIAGAICTIAIIGGILGAAGTREAAVATTFDQTTQPLQSMESSPVPSIPGIDAEDPSGREVAAYGTLADAAGTLRAMHDEWFLEAEGQLYELHMGTLGHEGNLGFSDGSHATVQGFILGNHIAPVNLATEKETHHFWRIDRMPVWSGNGGGKNRVEYQGQRNE